MPHRSETHPKGARGFASMDAEKQRAIASAGGRAAHRSGNAHEFDSAEAREAGRRGGLARSASRAAARTVELAGGQGTMQLGTSGRSSEVQSGVPGSLETGRDARKPH